jgi:pyridoxine 5-phosphate synthase|tara:strand:+ start:234 stop:947 length:714 start_codon:yes stop_codon:yes gene_type:complete
MTKLSVNVNKIATLRNARGGTVPNLVEAVKNIERFGADGITVHPRPDERHITYKDVYDLKKVVSTEFNIEGYPNQRFIDLVLEVKPEQVTLVPDPPGALTSNAGWNTIQYHEMLRKVISQFKVEGIRTSIFIETDADMIKAAVKTGTDRIELYTESYAKGYGDGKEVAVEPFVASCKLAVELGLAINAGHDLNLENLRYFALQCEGLLEVSIGHALVSDALYLGLENVVRMYKRELR